MFVELPELSKEFLIAVGAAFLIGWILGAILTRLGARYRARKRDPRDDRIRELEAEVRIARSETEKAVAAVEKVSAQTEEHATEIERRDNVITEQQAKLEQAAVDLRESVLKTRELRSELTERATENVHAEAKIREVETELSVAQASTDMIATGVLDYSFISDNPESSDAANLDDAPDTDQPSKATR